MITFITKTYIERNGKLSPFGSQSLYITAGHTGIGELVAESIERVRELLVFEQLKIGMPVLFVSRQMPTTTK